MDWDIAVGSVSSKMFCHKFGVVVIPRIEIAFHEGHGTQADISEQTYSSTYPTSVLSLMKYV
jgi:hypothetical protein